MWFEISNRRFIDKSIHLDWWIQIQISRIFKHFKIYIQNQFWTNKQTQIIDHSWYGTFKCSTHRHPERSGLSAAVLASRIWFLCLFPFWVHRSCSRQRISPRPCFEWPVAFFGRFRHIWVESRQIFQDLWPW